MRVSLKYFETEMWNVLRIFWKYCYVITGIYQKINICYRQIIHFQHKSREKFLSKNFLNEFLRIFFHPNVSWMPGTLQRFGNTQRIFLEYCMPAGYNEVKEE